MEAAEGERRSLNLEFNDEDPDKRTVMTKSKGSSSVLEDLADADAQPLTAEGFEDSEHFGRIDTKTKRKTTRTAAMFCTLLLVLVFCFIALDILVLVGKVTDHSEPDERISATTTRSDTSPSSLLQANPRDSADPPPFPFSTEAGAVDSELDVSTLSSILEIETESAEYNNAAQTLSYLESRLKSHVGSLSNPSENLLGALQGFQKGVSCATSMFALGASCGEVAGCVLDCLELSTAEPSACRDSCGVEASSECGVAFDGVVAFCG